MSNIKTINNSTNNLYRLQENNTGFVSNAFPVRRLVRSSLDHEQAWIAAYKTETQKYFEAVLTNQKLEELERENLEKEKKNLPKRRTLKATNFVDGKRNPHYLDGFYLMQLCCVEDPLDLAFIDISNKDLHQIKEEDMGLFENIVEINANENSLIFESFKNFSNLKNLFLACNNIKSIRLKHEEFNSLEFLDLSFNNLVPIDTAHLGILANLKCLKLTGNNLTYLPDTFTKLYVYTKDNKKIVSEKFPNLEELFLDHNKLKEEDSFDVLAVLKKLKRLHLNSNCISCIPNLKIYRKNYVFQEFNKSYYKRKGKRNQSAKTVHRTASSKLNESIVKDLERPNSELNMHSSNVLRNSFILEENEEELQETNEASQSENQVGSSETLKKKSTNNTADNSEKSFDLPFSELVFINLADNQISEEDDLIPLVSWPMLNEIIIYGNPIVYNNVGYPPLLKQYLIDRLGINIHRIRPLKPLKTPILLPQREHRIIETSVPKIPKMPVEMRMLTYNSENGETSSRRSNLSSAESTDRRRNSAESFDSTSNIRKNDHVYKPFKQEKTKSSLKEDGFEIDDEADEDETKESKNYDSFFMTQVDQDEQNEKKKLKSPRATSSDAKRISKSGENFKDYEILLKIENEDQIKVPKDIGGSIRALKHMLDHPLIFREPCRELDKPQAAYRTILKNSKNDLLKPKHKPKLTQINEILDTLKDRKTVTESSLVDALANKTNKTEYIESKRLLEKAQAKYNSIKRESLQPIQSQKLTKALIKTNLEHIVNENELGNAEDDEEEYDRNDDDDEDDDDDDDEKFMKKSFKNEDSDEEFDSDN